MIFNRRFLGIALAFLFMPGVAAAVPLRAPSGMLTYTYGVDRPVLQCPVFGMCVVELEKGERVTDRFTGDPRFLVDTSSDQASVPLVVVKATEDNLTSRLTIQTDKRYYVIRLRSVAKGLPGSWIAFKVRDAAMPSTVPAFAPPDPESASTVVNVAFDQAIEDASRTRPLEAWDTDYTIHGCEAFTPVFAFNDGVRTFYAMPDSMPSAPLLREQLSDGSYEPLNVSYRGKFYVIDHLANTVEFSVGDSASRHIVTVSRGRAERSCNRGR